MVEEMNEFWLQDARERVGLALEIIRTTELSLTKLSLEGYFL